MKSGTWSFLHYNKFEFGKQKVSQFVIFECKYLFSVIIFYFHQSNNTQDRFHTHAFDAISFKLFGNYTEYILLNENTGEFESRRRTTVFQFFPRDSYHMIGKSNGCMTLLFSGPWQKTWKEYVSGKIIHYSWNRKSQ